VGHFKIHPDTGELTVSDLLDREEQDKFNLIVQVSIQFWTKFYKNFNKHSCLVRIHLISDNFGAKLQSFVIKVMKSHSVTFLSPGQKLGCVSTFEWSTMILRCLHVFYGSLRQNLHHWHVYSGVPHLNRGKTGKM